MQQYVTAVRIVLKKAVRINSWFSSTLLLLDDTISRAASAQLLAENALWLRLT